MGVLTEILLQSQDRRRVFPQSCARAFRGPSSRSQVGVEVVTQASRQVGGCATRREDRKLPYAGREGIERDRFFAAALACLLPARDGNGIDRA
jgi:hypothetical protein